MLRCGSLGLISGRCFSLSGGPAASVPRWRLRTSLLGHLLPQVTFVCLLLLSLVDATIDTSRGRKRDSASISRLSNDEVAGGNIAIIAADVTAGEPAVAAHSTADDTQADPPGEARKRRRARPHKARVARRLGMHDGNTPPNPGMGTSHGADGS